MKNNKYILLLLSLTLVFASCKKDTIDDKVFQLNKVKLYANAADKLKEKTESQWIAVLYTNLFQQALSASDIYRAGQCITSIGDKELAREVIISNFMNYTSPLPVIPTNATMRANTEIFIQDTYERFLIRRPNQGEKAYFKDQIENDANRTAEIVFFSFALSNEYLFY
jgi:hypothetical protein